MANGIGNYHTHTRHCDGSGEPRDFAEAALSKGMPRLGFSGHNVVPFPTDWTMPRENLATYLDETRELKARYAGRLEVFVGMEVDYIPGLTSPSHPDTRALGLDFVIGSVHFIGPTDGEHEWTVDGPREELETALRKGFGGSMCALVQRYYRLVGRDGRNGAARHHRPFRHCEEKQPRRKLLPGGGALVIAGPPSRHSMRLPSRAACWRSTREASCATPAARSIPRGGSSSARGSSAFP